MRDCGPGTCVICGKHYTKQTANAQVCGDECRRERDNQKKRISKGPLPGHHKSACVICGTQFYGRLPNYPYTCCGAVECRKEIRKQGGKASAKTVAAQKKSVKVTCLKCGKSWKSPSRFIRTCPECKRNQEAHETYSEAWGAVI